MPKIMFNNVRILLETDNKYIQLDDHDDATLRSIWPQLVAKYPGFDVDLCYHNNTVPHAFLNEIGAELVDDCVQLHLNKSDMKTVAADDVTAVTEANFDAFATLHDAKNPDVYWTSSRLRQEPHGWDILAIISGNEMIGYAAIRSGWEVYFLHASNVENMLRLLSAAVRRGFTVQTYEREILYNVDSSELMQLEVAKWLGFRRTGFYVGYSAKAG